MSSPVALRGASRPLVPHPARTPGPAAPAVVAPVIDVDLRRIVPAPRAAATADRAAARYGAHGSTLLDEPSAPAVRAAGHDVPVAGWASVGRWLALVTLLSALALACALVGHAAR